MYTNRWAHKRRATKRKAIFLTVLFHLILFSGIWYANQQEDGQLLPEFMQEWFDKDAPSERA